MHKGFSNAYMQPFKIPHIRGKALSLEDLTGLCFLMPMTWHPERGWVVSDLVSQGGEGVGDEWVRGKVRKDG